MHKEDIFISALLNAKPEEQNEFLSKEIKLGIFALRHKEMSWVMDYQATHNKFPSLQLFNSKFGKSGKLKKVKDSVAGTLQEIIDIHVFSELCRNNEVIQDAIDKGKAMKEVISLHKQLASDLNDFNVDYVDVDIRRSTGALSRYKTLVRDLSDKPKTFMDTPWESLNRVISYFRIKETAILTARTSMGKSWLALAIAHHLAAKGIDTLFLSLEMSNEAIEDRLDCIRFKIPYDLFRKGELPPKTLARYIRSKKNSLDKKYPFILSADGKMLTPTGMRMIETKVKEHNPRVVIVDGAYKFYPDDLPKNANDVARFSKISAYMNAIAKQYNCLVIPVIQQNREAEKASSAKGKLSSIYGADAWAQDADWAFDIGGVRGSKSREISLLKGRESALLSFKINFELFPHPNFSELVGSVSSSGDYSDGGSFKAV